MEKIDKILQFDNDEDLKILTRKLPKLKTPDDYKIAEDAELEMYHACDRFKGYGLSANQIGIMKRFFVIKTSKIVDIFINPILVKGEGSAFTNEGCLSFDYGRRTKPQKRYKIVHVEWNDIHGEKHKATLTGIESIVFQHELDHMNGIII